MPSRGFHEQGSAAFLITFGREPGRDEMASLVEEEDPISVRRQMGMAPSTAAGHLRCSPNFLARVRIQTAKTSGVVDGAEVVIVDQ